MREWWQSYRPRSASRWRPSYDALLSRCRRNIAEGSKRRSPQDYAHFLNMAEASLAEASLGDLSGGISITCGLWSTYAIF